MSSSSIEQRTPEWFEQRNGRVTASSVGAIMGLAPYQSRKDVLRRMVREYHGLESEFCGNAATEWGTFNEAGAIAEFEMETGLTVTNAPFVAFGHKLGASPDGYVSDGKLIEVKCPFGLRNGGEFKSITEQMHYYAQMQMQMLCTERFECYFYQWTPHATKLEVVLIDIDFINKMLANIDAFWDEYLREIKHPERYGDKIVIESDLMDEYQILKKAIADCQSRQKELLAEMVALTGEKGGRIGNHTLYKVERDGAISYAKAIKELLPNADLEPYRGSQSTYWAIK
jgi:putative phage-type endonuclease